MAYGLDPKKYEYEVITNTLRRRILCGLSVLDHLSIDNVTVEAVLKVTIKNEDRAGAAAAAAVGAAPAPVSPCSCITCKRRPTWVNCLDVNHKYDYCVVCRGNGTLVNPLVICDVVACPCVVHEVCAKMAWLPFGPYFCPCLMHNGATGRL